MNFTLERQTLLTALTRIGSIAQKNHSISVCRHTLIEATTGQVTFRATNLDMEITVTVPADVSKPGVTLALADTLLSIAKNASAGADITFDLGDRLAVKSGRSRFNLAVLPVDEFPLFPALDKPVSFEMPAKYLAMLLSKPFFAVGHNMSWFALTGVHLFSKDGRIGSVATDQKRLTLYEYEADVPEFGVILPAAMVTETLKLLDGDAPANVAISKAKVSVVYGGAVITSKVIDGEYVEFRRVIPAEWTDALTVDREMLSATIRRASIASDVNSMPIRMEIGASGISVTARSQESGSEAADECECAYDGPERSMGMNASHMLDALAALDGETAELMFSTGPVMFRSPGDEDFRAIVMPLKG